MAKKYYIIPVSRIISETLAETAEDALVSFAGRMDSDMGAYFRAVTEDEYRAIRDRERTEEHREFVTSWMESVILEDFTEIPKDEARAYAECAYEIYCRGDGDTEYGSIQKAVEEGESGK